MVNPLTIEVAVVQTEPSWLDLDKTVQKTCDLIREVATNGAKLIAFPECWIPGYPAWIWTRPVDFDLSTSYIKNSLCIPSPQFSAIQAAAAETSITVVLGFSENHQGSLYISQAIISSDDHLLTHCRKIKPTHTEHTIFGDAARGSDTLANTTSITLDGRRPTKKPSDSNGDGDETDVNIRVCCLSCWEHAQPLLKYHTALQRPFLHIAAWPPVYPHGGPHTDPTLWSMSAEGCRTLSQTFAIESQAFVLHTTSVLTDSGIERMGTANSPLMGRSGGGSSAIFGADGRKLTKDLDSATEGVMYATLDLDEILKAKGFLDLGGHYSRPDILWLGVDEKPKKHVVKEEAS